MFTDLESEIEDYIDYYNNDRPQWTMNKMTPKEYHQYLINSTTTVLQLPAFLLSNEMSHPARMAH